jgi:hypothetical protein
MVHENFMAHDARFFQTGGVGFGWTGYASRPTMKSFFNILSFFRMNLSVLVTLQRKEIE